MLLSCRSSAFLAHPLVQEVGHQQCYRFEIFNGANRQFGRPLGSAALLAKNFVKIQQRVPVHIDFEGLTDEENQRLAAGMMCEIKVKVE